MGQDLDFLRAAYDGEILYWDTQLGRLLSRLGDIGLADDTVVIVTSDHGEEFLDHGKLKHGRPPLQRRIDPRTAAGATRRGSWHL